MGFMVRAMSALAGERNADPLVRQAGALNDVYGLLTQVWTVDSATPYDPWSAPRGEQERRAHIWAAYVRLEAAQRFMEADTAANRWTVGYLPPVSYDQVETFLDQVARHRSAALQLAAHPDGDVGGTPAIVFDDWARVEPCPPEHLAAMIAVARDMLVRADTAMAMLAHLDANGPHRADIALFQQLFRAAQADTSYAIGRYAPIESGKVDAHDIGEEEHEAIEDSIREAFATLYRLGLCLAMPSLLRVQVEERPKETRLPGPRDRGFDPWCLTSKAAEGDRRTRRSNPEAREAIEALWRVDPNPTATLAIQAQINDALANGSVRDTGRYYFCCPWAPIYHADRQVRLGGRTVRAGEEFTYDVSGEELSEDGAFVRHILVDKFGPTNKVDYCNPNEGGGHHDD